MSRKSPLAPLPANPARSTRDGNGEYRVFSSGHWFFRYDVTGPPRGSLLTVAITLWGARRAIRKDRRQAGRPDWWTNAVVWREES